METHSDLLFGTVAVDRGYLSPRQIQDLVEEQGRASTPIPLGELCVKRGWLSPEQVQEILDAQKPSGASARDARLGALAVRNRMATESEVEVALEAQRANAQGPDSRPAKIGEILVDMGTLAAQEVGAILAAQARLRQVEGGPAKGARLLQKSGPTIRVNDEPVTQARPLKAGDRLAIGDTVLVLEGESGDAPVLVPAPKEPSTQDLPTPVPPVQAVRPQQEAGPPAEERKGPAATFGKAEAAAEKAAGIVVGLLCKIDGVVARVLPKVHNQRKYVVAAAALGILAMFLPWQHVHGASWASGFHGVGWVAFFMFGSAGGLALSRSRDQSLGSFFRVTAIAASFLAFLTAAGSLIAAAASFGYSAGIGIYLAVLAGASIQVATWFVRPPAASETSPGAPHGFREKLKRLFRDVSGRRAEEKAAALQRRDDLLKQLGEAALEAAVRLPEAESAAKALENLEAVKAKSPAGGNPSGVNMARFAKDLVAAKNELKAAEGRADRALRKLGRTVVDQGIALEGQPANAEEVKALDAKIQDLS